MQGKFQVTAAAARTHAELDDNTTSDLYVFLHRQEICCMKISGGLSLCRKTLFYMSTALRAYTRWISVCPREGKQRIATDRDTVNSAWLMDLSLVAGFQYMPIDSQILMSHAPLADAALA